MTLKINKNHLYSTAMLLLLAGCGKAEDNHASATAADQSAAAVASVPTDNSYVTGADLQIQSETGGVLPKGTQVTMLETKQDARLGTLVHLGVDSDDESVPADVWVSMSELVKNGFEKQSEFDLDGLDARRGGMTYCYRYVKLYLIKIGKVKEYLPGGSAYMAASILPKYGFHKIKGGPSSAQINDVCVYRGGRGGHGHAEVRVKGGWYYGYGVIGHPINPSNHPFLGCFRK